MPTQGKFGEVTISGRRTALPFSKEILAHSLVDSGMSRKEALLTAEEIQRMLKVGMCYTKNEISRIVYLYLKSKGLERMAEDYRETVQSRHVINVVGRHGEVPFSKVILARSIRTAGVDMESAFEIAQDVELALRSLRRKKISTRRLRMLVFDILRGKRGEKCAKNYLLWREALNNMTPLVLLIGGATGVGKSTLAIEMASLLDIPYVISTDVIREMMKTFFSKDLFPFIHHPSYMAGSAVKIPSVSSPVLEGFSDQAVAVSVGVKARIRRAEVENIPMIVNGVHLIPGIIDVKEFDARIIQILLYMPDKEIHRNRFRIRQRQTRKRSASNYIKHFERIRAIQSYLVENAKSAAVPVISALNMEKAADATIRYISEKLAEEEALRGRKD
ncbi:MAG: hypothetical protein N2234_09510 [Planctomycetota bacterium]|nr:hypothetical protein [Planctomycetota bacterium]